MANKTVTLVQYRKKCAERELIVVSGNNDVLAPENRWNRIFWKHL